MINFTKFHSIKSAKWLCGLMMLMISSLTAYPQVGLNTTGAPPNADAGLDIDFANKGLLIPRVALTGTTSASPMSAHVAGMMVYNTATTADVTPGFYFNNGTKWVPSIPSGNTAGDMLYWNGSAWTVIPAGLPGQILQLIGPNTPGWGGAVFSTITTTAATNITGISATSGGSIASDGGDPVLARGVCWNITGNPTTASSKTLNGSGIGTFVSNITGLSPVTTYYVRAYATNTSVTTYGNQVSFTTLPVMATVTTATITAITPNSATGGGNVTNEGGSPVTAKGICWSTTTNPTIAGTHTTDGTGTGSFVSSMTGLTGNTTYYVRAYATNGVGTAYGTQVSFATTVAPPTVFTNTASNITFNSATSGGNVTDAGGNGVFVYARGVCYSTSPNPTTANSTVSGGSGTGAFVCNLIGLLGSTTYYIRAYATNSAGTAYGNQDVFATLAPVAPTLSTTAISSITYQSAVSGGNAINDGGSPITAKGVCWDTLSGPLVTGSHTTDGTGTNNFISSLTGLLGGKTYYVRAYATNGIGTSYGNELSFTTCGTPIYNVGDQVLGGVVFYVDCTGQHGLVAALSDQGTTIQWGCSGTVTGATGTAIYSGANNTTLILAACSTAGIAAKLCHDYNGGGFTDWYLPSIGELQEMYNQRGVIPNLTYGVWTYWSSTEGSATIASGWFFNSGYQQAVLKGYATQMVCRAIRAF
jgi:hypothetical protein